MRYVHPLLKPAVAVQGYRFKRRAVHLPPAQGPTTGSTSPGRPATARVLVIGESTAAGCGSLTHKEAFPGSLAEHLARATGHVVEWEVHGVNGYTVRHARRRLVPEVEQDADLAILLIGVNDTLQRTAVTAWRDELSQVLAALSSRAQLVLMPGLPPFESFPALPTLLGSFLQSRADELDRTARDLCRSMSNVFWMESARDLDVSGDFYARDGFHPSPVGYRRWAHLVCERALAITQDHAGF